MSDELDVYANITICYEPHTAPNLSPHASVVLDVEGRNRKVSFVIPTGPVPQHITLATCNHWIEITQGPVLSGCGTDDDQREVLLHLFLAYRAFVRGLPGTKTDHWYRFASQLVILTCEASPHEHVDDHLRQIIEWLHDALPVNIFLDPSIPTIVYNDASPPAQLEHIVVEPNAIPCEEQVTLRKHLEATISRLVLVALRAVPDGMPPEIFGSTLLHFARNEDARRAQLAAVLADGAMPPNVPTLEDVSLPTNFFCESRAPGQLYVTVEMPAYLVGSVHTTLVDLITQCSIHKFEPNGATTVLPIIATYPMPPLGGPPPPAPVQTPIAPSTPSLAPVQAPVEPSTPPTAASTPPTAPATPVTSPSIPVRLTLDHIGSNPSTTANQHGPAPLGTPRATSSPRATHPRTRASATTPVRRSPRGRDVEAAIEHRRVATQARRERQQEQRAARTAAHAAIRASIRVAGEYVTDSDDSMPLLRTVTDSSDESAPEFNLAYPGDN